MRKQSKTKQWLILCFCGGCLLFNYPLVAIVNRAGSVGGIPILFISIFISWLFLISLMASTIELRR